MRRPRYENMDKNITTNSFRDVFKWYRERRKKKKDLSFQVPLCDEPTISFLQENRTVPTITWIGHSTFLIQLKGKNILTDPVWAKRLGPTKRITPPGIPIDALPPIDYVFISHSHYDHLHYSSIKKLKGTPTFFVPIGLGRWFTRRGFSSVIECKWWDEHTNAGFKIAFVPAQHWTRRTLTDTNCSHWGGWIIAGEKTVYFAGDSGYFKGFHLIGKRYAIDYCCMPIGAYEPEWFMKNQHVNPEEAIHAFLDTGAHYMIPMHYGAYLLADDTPKEALDRLLSEWERLKLPKEQLLILSLGETLKLVKSSSPIKKGLST